jgi:hypothetical protein
MSDLPQEFDLKFLPDWLKEAPAQNRYANYEGDTGDRGDRRGGDRGDRRPPRNDRGGQGDRRGPRPPGGDRRGPRPGGPQGPRREGGGPRGEHRRDDRRDDRGPREPRPAPAPQPAQLKVEFLPETNAANGIARQIKSSGRAYGVFHTAKLFLERPERHTVRLTSADPNVLLHQIGDGPVSFDRAAVERGAFHAARADYYSEEIVQGEPIKGNFTNVARSRTTGVLLGPTSYHAYQPGLRKLYEERFSRRMSFQEFVAHEIEIVSGEQAVADWKEQARSKTTFTTLRETEPVTFESAAEVEAHFRKNYLPQLVKSGTTLECSGPASRAGLDRHVSAAVRDAWERERPFPQQLVNNLRPYFMEAGLHFFKHRKRMLFVSAHKPARHTPGEVFSDGIASILITVEEASRIKRPVLAAKLLGEHHDSPDLAPRKAALAADLHYLILAGHVIEFSDGALELPLPPKAAHAAATAEPEVEEAAEREAEPAPPANIETTATVAEPGPIEVAPVANALPEISESNVLPTPVAPLEEAVVAEHDEAR